MPVNPNIALSFKPFQAEPQNALADYATIAKIQEAQQAQQLNALKMQEYQRGVLEQNRLGEMMRRPGFDVFKPEHQAEMYQVAPSLAATRIEQALKTRESAGKIGEYEDKRRAAGLKALGQSLLVARNDPSDAGVDRALSMLDAVGVDTKGFRQQFAQVPDLKQRSEIINAYIMSNPDAKAAIEFTQPKPEKADLNGKIVILDMNPNSPTFKQEMKSLEKTKTAHEATMEGFRSRELAVKEEEERRAKDPVFQQRMAQAKATGEAIAKGDVAAQRALPVVISRAEEGLRLIDELVGKQEVRDKSGKVIEKGTAPHEGFSAAVGATWLPGSRFVPGTAAADFATRFDQIKGASFLEAFESLKGGGAITEKEGAKGTEAINRMSLAQSEKEFVAAARDLQDVIRKGVANAQRKASMSGGVPTAAPAAAGGVKFLGFE